MTKENYIIFSSIDWSTNWQIHHQLAQSLSLNGNKVLFIENTGIRSINIHDSGRIKERIVNWKNSLHGYKNIDKNIVTFSPLLLPFPYSKVAVFINKIILINSLSRWIKAANFNSHIVISFLPTPVVLSTINYINPKLVIYYCANNFSKSSDSAKQVIPHENDFILNSDMVFVISRLLQERVSAISNDVYYFPPGVDFIKFKNILESDDSIPDDLSHIELPIIGYIGAISKVFDQELVLEIASQLPEFMFVLVGPKCTDTSVLEKASNILFVGAKPHNLIPNYIRSFKVAIIPYVCNDFTNGVFPSKLIEYLSMGVPVVATEIRELVELSNIYNNSYTIASNVNKFVDSIRVLSKENNSSLRNQRIEVAEDNSWDKRFKEILTTINKELKEDRDRYKNHDWKVRLNNIFSHNLKFKSGLLGLIFSFLVVFYTPLFWIMGGQLVVKDLPKRSDAIVVFSGDGEVSYQNSSYQKRALDAISLYSQGYADKIFLSSGREQTISGVKMIKLYLIDRGVHESSIYILDKYPNSTYQNVMMVKQSLDNENVSSILFLTSPYHSLRSMLTWSKNAPNIKVLIPEVVDSPSKIMQWSTSFKDVRVIFYEFIAIAHNWIVGRV